MPSREVTQRLSGLLVLVVAVILTSGCIHNTYTPKIKLDESQKTIKAKVQVESFLDKSPAADRESTFAAPSATSSKVFEGPLLATTVMQAILNDFRSNAVFDSIRKHDQDADLVLKGTIYRFYMVKKLPWQAWVPFLGLVNLIAGGTASFLEGKVDIELILCRKDGTVINNYRAIVDVPEEEVSSYDQKAWEPVGDHLDKAFTEAVRRIRDLILADEVRIRHVVKLGQASQ